MQRIDHAARLNGKGISEGGKGQDGEHGDTLRTEFDLYAQSLQFHVTSNPRIGGNVRAGRDLKNASERDMEKAKEGKLESWRWCNNHGNIIRHLQAVAIRLLSQACRASACEGNWSAHDAITPRSGANFVPSTCAILSSATLSYE